MSTRMPRPEHPRPTVVRDDWICLNGVWEFERDPGDSGRERGLHERALSGRITVPFAPESALSGIGDTDFMPAAWYRRELRIPAAWAGKRALLHFQAVDHEATVFVDGVEAYRHRGGFTPFTVDLHGLAAPGDSVAIAVRARDLPQARQPRGKQSPWFASRGCHYTRTTGIWQSVWLEAVPHCHLLRPRVVPDLARARFLLELRLARCAPGMRVRARLLDGDGVVAQDEARADLAMSCWLDLVVPPARLRLWAPGDGQLYGLELEALSADGTVVDSVRSHCGMRAIAIDGPRVLLNGKPVFQRLVLDQGYWPDGVLTAPSDEALRRDIAIGLEAGFNGARLHQKVFEERFLFHADRMGWLCWGEFPDWDLHEGGPKHADEDAQWITQWQEAVARDQAHPCIVGWCGLNETLRAMDDRMTALDDVTLGMFLAARNGDGTRPVLDASGYAHRVRESDIYDCHDYEQDVAAFAANHAGLRDGRPFVNRHERRAMSAPWRGQPFFVSEFGGIWWNPDAKPGDEGWGYGSRPTSEEEFHRRFAGLCATLLDDEAMFGYCYTQLTDVHPELNGVVRFDRTRKLDLARLRAAQQRPAAIERAAASVG